MHVRAISILFLVSILSACALTSQESTWLLIDNFESNNLDNWKIADTQNNTSPFIANPQVTEIRSQGTNHYLIKKPAKDGVVGNRKALSYTELPQPVEVGEVYTFYTKILIESFPNNHAFGISNLGPKDIEKQAYNAFEPTLRVTDKYESNGYKNDGTLMVKIDSSDKYRQYSNIQNYALNKSARPLKINTWYNIWYVVDNQPLVNGGQTYDVYIQGGEFKEQTLVYKAANFRMKREMPLIYFFATTNTGPIKKPYGNGGLAYDDIYMAQGVNLSYPVK